MKQHYRSGNHKFFFNLVDSQTMVCKSLKLVGFDKGYSNNRQN